MNITVKTKFEIGNNIYINCNGHFKNAGKIIDVYLYTQSGLKYLVELQDKSREWFREDVLHLVEE